MYNKNILGSDILNEIFGKNGLFSELNNITKSFPAINIYRNDKFFNIDLAHPGSTKEDYKIDLEDGILSVIYTHINDTDNSAKIFLKHEYNLESFTRKFNIPDDVDVENIKSTFNNGVLNITIPIVDISTPKKEIAID